MLGSTGCFAAHFPKAGAGGAPSHCGRLEESTAVEARLAVLGARFEGFDGKRFAASPSGWAIPEPGTYYGCA